MSLTSKSPTHQHRVTTAVPSQWPLVVLTILALSLPFEINTPLFHVGPIAVTNVEFILGMVLVTAVFGWYRWGFSVKPSRWVWVWALFFIFALLTSALLAPSAQGNAVKASLRLLSGLILALFAIPILIRNWKNVRWVLWILLLSGFLATFIGLIEYLQNREILWLSLFREQPTLAGGFIRLTGSFDYANQTAMFIEATFPILLCTIWFIWRQNWVWTKKTAVILPLTLMTFLYLQASILTFSRTSIVTIGIVTVIMAALLWYNQNKLKKQMSVLWLGVTTTIILLILLNSQFNNLFRLRLQTEGDNEWYRAELTVPDIVQMETNETRTIPISLTNNGSLTWRSNGNPPINLGARWLDTTKNLSVSEPRWLFTNPVTPGQHVVMNVTLQAPSTPGEYELIWDVVHERITWFGEKTNKHVIKQVNVIGDEQLESSIPTAAGSAIDYSLPIPDRKTLWTTAFIMWQERPYLGIGADNFRLTYGQALGATSWNETIHTNNWYVETAVSLGLIGSLIIFAGMLMLIFDIFRGLRQAQLSIWQIAIGAGILSFFIHGLLDFFLLFTATGLLFWLLLGLWLTTRSTTFTLSTTQVNDKDANWI